MTREPSTNSMSEREEPASEARPDERRRPGGRAPERHIYVVMARGATNQWEAESFHETEGGAVRYVRRNYVHVEIGFPYVRDRSAEVPTWVDVDALGNLVSVVRKRLWR